MNGSERFLLSDFGEPSGPPPMHPNRIHAAYMDMLNKGQFYVPQLGGQPLTIHEWKVQEVQRWEQYCANLTRAAHA